MKRLRCILMTALIISLVLGSFGFYGGTLADAQAFTPIQLVSDQDHIVPDGKLSFHLIYHQVDNKANTNIQVHVPAELEPADQGNAEWDAELRVLKWQVQSMENNKASVFHFQLKVKADAKWDTEYGLDAKVEVDGEIKWQTPKVKVIVSTDVHQPFMRGYPDGTFRPQGLLTRAETAAMIARIKGLKTYSAAQAYDDVKPSHWAYKYIQQVTDEGYMEGYNRKFRPSAPITKAEFVAIMLRLRIVEPVPLKSDFDDMQNHWASYVVGIANELKFLDGVQGVKFLPDEPIARQSAAKLMNIGLKRGPLKDGEVKVVQHFPDVAREHVYFGWIEEASSVAHESENRGDGGEYLIRYLPEQTNPF